MTTPLVEVRGLRVGYPRRAGWALDGLDLDVAPGEQLLVIGASGSGKSTLLHLLAGLVPRNFDADVAGRARIDGLDPVATPTAQLSRTVGLLRQDPVSQVALPLVEDELAFVLENRSTAPERISDLVDRALARVGLPHLRGRRTSTLSGGELQRVALAATLLGDPQLLLLDEPTAMLDPVAAGEVGALITGPDVRARATVLIEHRLGELPRLPERVALLDTGGGLRAHGATAPTLAAHAGWLVATGAWLPPAVELGLARGGRVAPEEMHRPIDQLLDRHAGTYAGFGDRSRPVRRPRPGAALRSARGVSFGATVDGPTLVNDLDLDLRAGEVTAVIGANGSGKTSLLLGLAGFLPLLGGEVSGAAAGMVFQHPEHQLLGRSVADDLARSLPRVGRRRVDSADPRVTEAVARFGLDGLEDADPFRLSGGQKRRLTVAAMSLTEHPVLLLDEPTFGQDRRTSRAIAGSIDDLARDGRAVALSTHDLRLAARLADRTVVLRRGRVEAVGAPDAILADADLLARCGLRLPPVLAGWARHATDAPVREVLAALDGAVDRATAVAVAP